MAIEWILNSVMNRFQLNFKRNVGATSESIRKCSPKTLNEWRDYYFKNVKSEEHIKELGKKIESAPDEWDRLFNVDFFIMIGKKYIGLQIKPVNFGIQLPEIHKEYFIQAETHKEFTSKFGGRVFYIFSKKVNGKKEIANKEIIKEIQMEMKRLDDFDN
ncbi:MAG: MjaI family restriction endonuclease [Bacteroidales bacterium]|jgi:hypothetical protein|nr:MjaI family restriction endonuclease [Bacteroidales bacterium]